LNTQDIISSGLLELYAAGLASPEEKAQVENWIKEYPGVAAELKAISSGLESYAQANAVEPSSGVKEKIFAAINTSTLNKNVTAIDNGTTGAKVIPIKNYWKWVAAASIVLLIGSAAMNMMYYNKYDTANKDLKATQEQLATAEQKNNESNADHFRDPGNMPMPVVLKEMQPSSGTTAKIFWMQDTREVMIDASNLPDPPAGMQYQFWGIVDSKPVDGGLIITNDKGKKFRMQKMKSFGRAEAFAISLEKEGGNPTPTKVVSMGKII
jgi:anti-sigma-K factor RskA